MVIQPTSLGIVTPYRKEAMQDGAHLYEGKTPILWYGAFNGEVLMGCIGLLPVATEARIRGWFVRRNFRLQGVGRALLEFAVGEARTRGFKRVEAKTAYREELRRWGWRTTGRIYTTFKPRSPGEQFVLDLA